MLGIVKKFTLKDKLFNSFSLRVCDGEEGAAGGADVTPPPAEPSPEPDYIDGVPRGFVEEYRANDPNYEKLIAEEKKLADKSEPAKGDTTDEPPSDEADGETPKEDDTPADDNSGEDEDSFDFQDDVIEGLKGEHLKAIPKEAKLAIADFYAKHSELTEKEKGLSARLEKLIADPVVRMREEMIKSGQDQFPVRAVTQAEKASLTQRLQTKLGVNAEEAELIFEEVQDHIKATSNEIAEDLVNNMTLQKEEARKVDEITSKGRNVFLELGKFNKALAFKETDGNKFWVKKDDGWMPNESHPEFKKFSETLIPVMTALGESGIRYKEIVNLTEKFGTEAVYAMVAKKLNLPVAINTEARDQKMLKSELQKRMAPFLKANTPSELTASAGKDKPATKTHVKNGYDIVKLASDIGYYERARNAKPNDMNHADMISRLAEEGDAIIRSKTKK